MTRAKPLNCRMLRPGARADMNQFLRNLTATQQIGALFPGRVRHPVHRHRVGLVRNLREHASDDPEAEAQPWKPGGSGAAQDLLGHGHGVLGGLGTGRDGGHRAVRHRGLFALREFIPVAHAPGRPPQPGAGVLRGAALQFWLVGSKHFDLFTVFIPVYVFPGAAGGERAGQRPQRFLERNAKLQWGIMVCVYGMSHVPALLLLDFPGYRDKGRVSGVLWCLWCRPACWCSTCWAALSAQTCGTTGEPELSVDQLAGWRGGQGPRGRAAHLHHPFKPGQALGMALLACVAGSLGHLVMKALKRDRGITSWGMQGMSVTGAGACSTAWMPCVCSARVLPFGTLVLRFL